MADNYHRIFSLRAEHRYYHEPANVFRWTVEPETRSLLERLGMRLRTDRGQAEFYAVSAEARLPDETLRFGLHLEDPAGWNVTRTKVSSTASSIGIFPDSRAEVEVRSVGQQSVQKVIQVFVTAPKVSEVSLVFPPIDAELEYLIFGLGADVAATVVGSTQAGQITFRDLGMRDFQNNRRARVFASDRPVRLGERPDNRFELTIGERGDATYQSIILPHATPAIVRRQGDTATAEIFVMF